MCDTELLNFIAWANNITKKMKRKNPKQYPSQPRISSQSPFRVGITQHTRQHMILGKTRVRAQNTLHAMKIRTTGKNSIEAVTVMSE